MRVVLTIAVLLLAACADPVAPAPCEPTTSTPLVSAAGDTTSVVRTGLCVQPWRMP